MNRAETERGFGSWSVVAGSTISLIISTGPVLQFTFGLFVKPVAQELGCGRDVISLALTVSLACTAVCTPIVGRLIDRFGVRLVCILSILLFASSMIAIGLTSESPVVYILGYALAGIFAAGQSPLPYAKAVASSFKKKRGLALGVTMTGVGLGVLLLPALTAYIIAVFGWRTAYFILGALLMVIALPAVIFLVHERDKVVSEDKFISGYSLNEALRQSIFWQMVIAVFFVALASSGIFTHVVPMMIDRGVTPELASRAISIGGIALIFGRLTSGFLLDRLPAKLVVSGFFLLPLCGIIIISACHTLSLALLGSFFVGLGLGAEVDMIAFLTGLYFGRRAFGEIYGYLFFVFMAGSSLGPLVMGLSFSHTGSYKSAVYALAIGVAVAVCATSRMNRPLPIAA